VEALRNAKIIILSGESPYNLTTFNVRKTEGSIINLDIK
jgi:hypothetical protein